jgi:predicted NBD/HSP70 family sugar kinase
MPVFVENDVNLAALGEWGYGAGQGCHNLVCIAIGTGAGSGIIIGDTLVRGHHHAAGEIGYLPTDVSCLGRRFDQFGAFETIVSGLGIAQRGREALARSGSVVPDPFGAEDVCAAARRGDDWAVQTIADTVDHLAVGIAAVSVLLDPEMIVLAGGVARSADLLVEPVQRRLEGVIPYVPPLVASPLDRHAVVLGGVAMVLNGTIGFAVVKRAV